MEFEETQKGLINRIARKLAPLQGFALPSDPNYLWETSSSRGQTTLYVAEQILEMFLGDRPDYADEDEQNEQNKQQGDE